MKAPRRVVLDTSVVLSALLFGGGPTGVRIPEPPPVTPRCRDSFDLPFLHLAIAGRAHAIVSGDKDLLALVGAPGLCSVLSVEAFCRELV